MPDPIDSKNDAIDTKQDAIETKQDAIDTKQALRRAVRATRRARSGALGAGIAAIALQLAPIRQATCVAIYASLPDEPDTAPLRQALHELGIRVLLPVVPADPSGPTDRRLDWALDDGPLIAGGLLALPEPQGELLAAAALSQADVVIVPALAVDTNGTRLGRGRGYYDAALRHVSPSALVIALIHDDELLDATTMPIPREPHDLPAHAVITPTRAFFFTSRPTPRP